MPQRNVRDQVLAAGLEVFWARGYHGSSVLDITTTAGVPKGSFYNHFPGKEDLAVAAIYAYAANSPYQMLLDTSPGSPLDRLRSHFDARRDRFIDAGFTGGCLMGNFSNEIADHSEPVRQTLVLAFDAWCALIESVLTQAQTAGELRDDAQPSTLANFIVNAWEGALTRAKTTKTDAPLTTFFDTVFGLLLQRSET